ncbi:hypothetical protein Sa4125_01710 [Aureimonas sp. SA4125]|uniref:hypothetical protein n=1 Tax=Aureimonas sp. SA4125 TaxID=2826993 RepID=UPI001CC35163|nr:hypothetical protein [Aureimonas sp. SA4125]BDA82629.1 hypothetical protein Sa4125_01710 [Aureimonas sp. SA4125]
MIRFVLRGLGAILLAAALVYAVADIARSLADEAVVLTPLSQALTGFGLPAAVPEGPSPVATDLIARVLGWPVSVISGVLALLLLAVGRPARRRAGKLSS